MRLGLFWRIMRLRMKEDTEYRGAYALGMLSNMVFYLGTYIVLYVLLRRFDSVAGWTWPEIAFLFSMDLCTYALGAAFTFNQMTAIEQMVTQGTFDVVLVRPWNAYTYLIARHFGAGYVAHVILAGGVLLWTLTQLPVRWTVANVTFLALALISGALVQAALITLHGAWALYFVRSGFLLPLLFKLRRAISFPISVYGAPVQVLLTAILPLAFINYYPAALLLSKSGALLPIWVGYLAPLVGPLCFWIAYLVWMRGANSYQSAGG